METHPEAEADQTRLADMPAINYEDLTRQQEERQEARISGDVVPAQAKGDPVARDGSVGEKTYAEVTKLVDGGMNRTQAFQKYADDNGAKAGTVAANYYRVARAQGASKSRRGRPRTAAPASTAPEMPTRTRQAARGSSDQFASELATMIERMVDAAVERKFKAMLNA